MSVDTKVKERDWVRCKKCHGEGCDDCNDYGFVLTDK